MFGLSTYLASFIIIQIHLSPDVNKSDFQDKFAGYGIYRCQNLPTNQKENSAKQTTRTAQKFCLYYEKKPSILKPKKLCSSKFESKNLHFRVFESESTLYEHIFFISDIQDPFFACYGYNLQVIFIYVCLSQNNSIVSLSTTPFAMAGMFRTVQS